MKLNEALGHTNDGGNPPSEATVRMEEYWKRNQMSSLMLEAFKLKGREWLSLWTGNGRRRESSD